MQFVYHKDSSSPSIIIEGESYNHLFKSRRQKKQTHIYTRNLIDDFLYRYEVVEIDKRSATLKLQDRQLLCIKPSKNLEIIWCIIDPKEIEKSIAPLNEIGVSKITFIYCQNSQNSYKIDLQRLNRLTINSSMQCGRSNLMRLEFHKDSTINDYIDDTTFMLDFGGDDITTQGIKRVIIGCEGGFAQDEKEVKIKKIGLSTQAVLKSTTATLSVASKILI
jgi:16S rRNA (uracil1498-N3)-methyltransferase